MVKRSKKSNKTRKVTAKKKKKKAAKKMKKPAKKAMKKAKKVKKVSKKKVKKAAKKAVKKVAKKKVAKKVKKVSKKKVKKTVNKAKKPVKKAVKKVVEPKAPPVKKEPLKLICNIVAEVAGIDVVPLARALYTKENVSEFSLATAIKQEINATRNMLYRLYDNNLVSFTRKKDKKKGWYIYYWTFNHRRIKALARELKNRRIERFEERLQREKNTQFYLCKHNCLRLDFDQSHDFQFKCPECGTLLEMVDNSDIIRDIEEELAELKKE